MRLGVKLPGLNAHVAGQTYAGAELLTIFAISIAIGQIYLYGHLDQHAFIDTYIWPSILTVAVFGYLNFRGGLYRLEKLSRFATYSSAAIGNLFLSFVAIAMVGVAVGSANDFSRLWFGLWLLSSGITVLTMRALAARIFASAAFRGAVSRTVAIFGAGEPLGRAIEALGASDSGASVAGIFGPEPVAADEKTRPRDGGLAELVDQARSQHLDAVIIALPLSQHGSLQETLTTLGMLPTEIKLMPDTGGQDIAFHGISSLARVQFIDLQHKPLSGWGRLLKAAEDYVIAAIATLLLLPVFLILALVIRLDSPGPVIFRQQRHGLNNRTITVFKFRTMNVQREGDAFRQATRNDRRVTRVGRFLRRTSLDELPQLFNVLRGEMSIVGPRPHAIEMNAAYARLLPLYETRHRVKPGITGWAQINDHRGPTYTVDDMRKRLDHDLYYIENWSLLFDLSIIAATPFIGLTHKNAL